MTTVTATQIALSTNIDGILHFRSQHRKLATMLRRLYTRRTPGFLSSRDRGNNEDIYNLQVEKL